VTLYAVEVESPSGAVRTVEINAADPVVAAWKFYAIDETHRDTVRRVMRADGLSGTNQPTAAFAPLVAALAVIIIIGAAVIAAALVVF